MRTRKTTRPSMSSRRRTGTLARKTAPKKTATDQRLKIIPLGGMEEVGKNMTIIEYGDDIVIIDMGLQFPEEDMPGIDYVIPDISYLRSKSRNIKGVIITHGHYDHIGAIPHLIPELGNPTIYTGKLSAGIIQKRNEEYRKVPKLNIQFIDEKSKIKLGSNFEVEFFRVNHNIPDSFGVALNTPFGTIVHTGDFKLDHMPINEPPADLGRLAKIGNNNVLALMSDSTSAESKGHQISESQVEEEMEIIFEKAPSRIIIGTFASLLSRIQQIINLSERFNKKILIEGRSMKANIEIAHELGFLKFPKNIQIGYNEMRKMPNNKVVIICTGAQGERNAVLMRIANDEHRHLYIKPNDTIIFSSSVIPGNERTIQGLKDTFARKEATVIHYKMMDIHAGGHAKQEDLKLMIRLVKPKYFIPIEASRFMLKAHADLAQAIGIPRENIFIPDNGQIVEFHHLSNSNTVMGKLLSHRVRADNIMVDGLGVGDVSNIVLRERRLMAEDGMFVVIATIDKKTGKLIGNPDLISRGFVYMKENKELIEKTRMRVKQLLFDKDPRTPANETYIKNKIKIDIGEFLFMHTKRRPMILPVIIEV